MTSFDPSRPFNDPTAADKLCDDCTEEYGVCERHSVVLVGREGASCRTGDELLLQFIADAIDLGVMPTPEERAEIAYLESELELARNPVSGTAWLASTDDSQAASDLARELESRLPHEVTWNDGYVIREITGGPFAS